MNTFDQPQPEHHPGTASLIPAHQHDAPAEPPRRPGKGVHAFVIRWRARSRYAAVLRTLDETMTDGLHEDARPEARAALLDQAAGLYIELANLSTSARAGEADASGQPVRGSLNAAAALCIRLAQAERAITNPAEREHFRRPPSTGWSQEQETRVMGELAFTGDRLARAEVLERLRPSAQERGEHAVAVLEQVIDSERHLGHRQCGCSAQTRARRGIAGFFVVLGALITIPAVPASTTLHRVMVAAVLAVAASVAVAAWLLGRTSRNEVRR